MHLIKSSNWRAHLAIISIRSFGRSFELMSELRDALNQRRSMREQAAFALWYSRHESSMREKFGVFVARHPFRFGAGKSNDAEWNDFVTGEYISEFK